MARRHSCVIGIDPMFDPAGLADNGSPTLMIALLPGSPAIDAGDPEVCANPPVNGADQRGHTRPGAGHSNCSIGAYEVDSTGPPPPTFTPTATGTATHTPPPTSTPTATRKPGGGGGGCAITSAHESSGPLLAWMLLPFAVLLRRRALEFCRSGFRSQSCGRADEVLRAAAERRNPTRERRRATHRHHGRIRPKEGVMKTMRTLAAILTAIFVSALIGVPALHAQTPTPTAAMEPGCDRDGIPEPENDEVCDDGNDVNGDGCDNNCTPTGCGNGILTAGEECDDSNTAACDGCSPACLIEPGFPCGNAALDPACGEACDDGNTSPCDGCAPDCRIETNVCGDGSVNPECEECDDGNRVDEDPCRNDCRNNVCGDGMRDPAAEQCDDGNGDDFDGCRSCVVCGNGDVTQPEECDDGNLSSADACRGDCRPNTCGDGYVNPAAEVCDDGNVRNSDGCDSNCTPTACGNGVVSGGEACDDGNLTDGDGCDSNCRPTSCGNDLVTSGEECDDGNRNPFDGCTRNCTICGNGIVTAPEECDDENSDPSDGCTNACTICGNEFVTPPESCDDGNLIDGDGCYSYCATPGCGNNVREGDEECDDGGVCIGGDNAGDLCNGPGGCLSGECEPAGGDGCAVNCTHETAHRLVLDPSRSPLGVQGALFHIGPSQAPDFTLSGELTLRTGRPRPSEQSGDIPVAINAQDVRLGPTRLPSLGCLCFRAAPQQAGSGASSGGTIACGEEGLDGVELLTSIDHDTNDIDPTCVNGTIEIPGECSDGVCLSGNHTGDRCRVNRDCGGFHEVVCNGPERTTASGSGPPGSALLELQLITAEIPDGGSCDVETNTRFCLPEGCVPAKGPDGIPCNEDDPDPAAFGRFFGFGGVYVLPFEVRARLTTSLASAEILDVNDQLGDDIRPGGVCGNDCITEATGSPFVCSQLLSGQSGDLTGVTLAAAIPTLDLPGIGDSVTTLVLGAPPAKVVGDGTPESCTEAALDAALDGGGMVTFDCGPEPITIAVTSTKNIAQDTAIDGGGLITISGGGQVGVFEVGTFGDSTPISLAVHNLTVADGSAEGGGGIAALGPNTTITVADSTITRNAARLFGGGLFSLGTLTVTNSTIAGNVAEWGGGIASGGGGPGGCVPAVLTVANSTISGNEARLGGGILGEGAVTVTNSTIAGNAALERGGGVFHEPCGGGELMLSNSIIADTSSGGECVGAANGTHNLIEGPRDACGLVGGVNGNIVGFDPLVDPAGLSDNGGPTQTIALLADSPAIDAGDQEVCANPPVNGVDQRGYARPGDGSVNCSIGAFEYNSSGPPPPVTATATPTATPSATPTPTSTPVPSVTPSASPTRSPSVTATATGTRTPTASATPSPSGTATIPPSGDGDDGCAMTPGHSTGAAWWLLFPAVVLAWARRRKRE